MLMQNKTYADGVSIGVKLWYPTNGKAQRRYIITAPGLDITLEVLAEESSPISFALFIWTIQVPNSFIRDIMSRVTEQDVSSVKMEAGNGHGFMTVEYVNPGLRQNQRKVKMTLSVQPKFFAELPLQMQSVLFLAARGPDGVRKDHPCKEVIRAYRACVFLAAYYGRSLNWGEKADKFMSMDVIANAWTWSRATKEFLDTIDELPHHYLAHLMHGVAILGYKHPIHAIRHRWHGFYLALVKDLHLNPETEEQLDKRLCDWNQEHWDEEAKAQANTQCLVFGQLVEP